MGKLTKAENERFVKRNGTLLTKENECEMYQIRVGNTYNFWMFSPKTGEHCVSIHIGMMDDLSRVFAHWFGFVKNQSDI
jgi:hypothetical protein